MKDFTTYLIFNGNCREAMTFYKDCLEAELNMFPFLKPRPMPEEAKDRTMHARLSKGGHLMASDNMPGMPFTQAITSPFRSIAIALKRSTTLHRAERKREGHNARAENILGGSFRNVHGSVRNQLDVQSQRAWAGPERSLSERPHQASCKVDDLVGSRHDGIILRTAGSERIVRHFGRCFSNSACGLPM